MIITKTHKRGGKPIYMICNSVVDNGDDFPDEIARFDSLELATVVLRYMRGDSLSEADEYRAKEALKAAAAATD